MYQTLLDRLRVYILYFYSEVNSAKQCLYFYQIILLNFLFTFEIVELPCRSASFKKQLRLSLVINIITISIVLLLLILLVLLVLLILLYSPVLMHCQINAIYLNLPLQHISTGMFWPERSHE